MKLRNKFIIIVPVFNAYDLIEECLSSIVTQNFDDLGIIIRDDISSDGTDKVIRKFLNIENDESNEVLVKLYGKDILFIRNTKKLYPLGNTYESVIYHVDNKDSIIGVVDGDDKLSRIDAVKKIFDLYEKTNKWMIWSQHKKSSGEIGESKSLPLDTQIYSNREYWSVTHFRTNKAALFHKLNVEDLMDPFVLDSYYTFAGDAAFLFPFCEMCGNENTYFLDEVLYTYNNNLPTNEHNKNYNNAVKYGMYIRNNGKRYTKLNKL